MTSFIQSYPPSMGAFPFSTSFDATTSSPLSGCLTTPPPSLISIDSPASQTNGISQSGMNYFPDSSFCEETTSTSSTPAQMEYSFPTYPSQNVPAAEFPECFHPQQPTLPTQDGEQTDFYQPQPLPDMPAQCEDNIPEPVKGGLRVRKQRQKYRRQQQMSTEMVEPKDSKVKTRPRNSRRGRLLERNRIAATKCRMRKRDEASALAAREQEMEERNRQLSRTLDELTAESYHLKTQLLRHTDCNCTLIHKYIAHEARKSVQELPPPPYPSPFPSDMIPLVENQSGSNRNMTNVNVTNATDSYGILTPELERVPPIWPDPSLPISCSPEAMLNTAMETAQKENIIPSSQLMPCLPPIHEAYYPCSWVSTGAPFPTMEGGAFWGGNWEF